MLVRPANINDCEKVFLIHIEHSDFGHANEPAKYSVEDFIKMVDDERTYFLVCEKENEVIGFCVAFQLPNWTYLDIVCVKFQYRRNLVATRFLDELSSLTNCIEFCVYKDDKETLMAAKRMAKENSKLTQWFVLDK